MKREVRITVARKGKPKPTLLETLFESNHGRFNTNLTILTNLNKILPQSVEKYLKATLEKKDKKIKN